MCIRDRQSPLAFSVFPKDTTIIYGQEVKIRSDIDSSPLTIKWSPNEGVVCDTCLTTTIAPKNGGFYTIEITDENGCISTTQIIIRVEKEVYSPTAFSPNQDGINDYFTLFGNPSVARILDLKIFGRWGQLVFEGYELQLNDLSKGWDGTFKGQDMRPGVYIYLAHIQYSNDIIECVKGDITLIR